MGLHQYFLLLLLLVITIDVTVGACQSCLVDLTVAGLFGYDAKNKDDKGIGGRHEILHNSALPLGLLKNTGLSISSASAISNAARSSSAVRFIGSPAMRFLTMRKLMSVAYSNKVRSRDSIGVMLPTSKNAHSAQIKSRWAGGLFIIENSESNDSLQENGDDAKMAEDSADSKTGEGEEIMSGGMIMAIGFYKSWISPLLPPACRFLPTCSQYGAQAIKEYGPQKGLILTAWRLARCSPLGGRGYDPPRWPPVPYTYGSY